jgi:BirA family transcriptional regulator, biotin operon repressor / biotin---[acetyl-CoA-carboxylase] ligase
MIGAPHVHHRVTDSTNERAKQLARAGAPHGTLVTAHEQTAGRGRQGRAWSAPAGKAVLMSVVLRGLEERHELLPLVAAVAVCHACEQHSSPPCAIKWPNDVWIRKHKLAGILVEGRPQEDWMVVGIGLNVAIDEDEFPEELRDTATSLLIEGGAPPLSELVDALAAHLGSWLDTDPGEVLAAWRRRDALRGERVGWGHGEGCAAGIDDSGALLVDTPDGRVALDASEVHLLR